MNSHTSYLYLDDPRFAPVLEAAEALDRPIYLPPRAPPNGMAAPFRDYGVGGSIWGFGAEAGTHAVRLLINGRVRPLSQAAHHPWPYGRGLPFWMWRLDHMYKRRAKDGRLKPDALIPQRILPVEFCRDDKRF